MRLARLKERCGSVFVGLAEIRQNQGDGNEASAHSCSIDGRASGLRTQATATPGDADLRGRHIDPGDDALPAAAATAAAAAGHLPGWLDAAGRIGLPGSAAAPAATAAAPRRRTRLITA
jgi:hypothetical protein